MTSTDTQRSGIQSRAMTAVAVDLADLIRQRAATWPERDAITFEGAASTYQDLDRRATRVLRCMARPTAGYGLGPGEST